MWNILNDGVLESQGIVTTTGHSCHISFPEPSGEPCEVTITRQWIALHVAGNAKLYIKLTTRATWNHYNSRICVYVSRYTL